MLFGCLLLSKSIAIILSDPQHEMYLLDESTVFINTLVKYIFSALFMFSSLLIITGYQIRYISAISCISVLCSMALVHTAISEIFDFYANIMCISTGVLTVILGNGNLSIDSYFCTKKNPHRNEDVYDIKLN